MRTYSHLFSPKKFTQPQLFACLVLKEFMRLDYRKLSALLQDAPQLATAIDLTKIPHFTTFQKAHERLLDSQRAKRLLDETVEEAISRRLMKRRVKLAAIDGTGFESRHVSLYYAKRQQKTLIDKRRWRRRYPKVGIVCDCHSHFILSVVPGRGPIADDKHFRPALRQAAVRSKIDTLLADAGYDSESAHEFARETHGMKTVIPPDRGRPTSKLPRTKWRKRMATHFDKEKYGQRWQVETVNSMIKRMLGSALRSRGTRSQNQEIKLRAITHNVMILRPMVFYRAAIADLASTIPKHDACQIFSLPTWGFRPSPSRVARYWPSRLRTC